MKLLLSLKITHWVRRGCYQYPVPPVKLHFVGGCLVHTWTPK
jgi:hypothetical protein